MVSRFGIKSLCIMSGFGLFGVHLFTCERYKNNFIEYDLIFLGFCALIVALFLLANVFIKAQSFIELDTIDLIGLLIISLIVFQSLFMVGNSERYLIQAFLFYCFYLFFRYSKNHGQILFGVFIAAALLTSVIDFFKVPLFNTIFFPPGASFINPNENANYYASIIPFLLGIVLFAEPSSSKKKLIINIVVIITLILAFYLLIKTFSKTAITATSVSLLFVCYQRFGTNILPQKLNKIQYAVLILFTISSICGLGYYLYLLNPDSVKGRFLIYFVGSKMIGNHPFFGIGFQQFQVMYNDFQSQYIRSNELPITTQWLAGDTYYSFNEFLQCLIEFGIVGFAAISAIIFLILKTIIQEMRNNRIASYGAIGSLISVFICSIFSNPVHTPSVLINCLFFISLLSPDKNLRNIQFTINTKIQQIGAIIIFLIAIIVSYKQYRVLNAMTNWEKAALYSKIGEYDEARNLYRKAYPSLSNHGSFLYNYGSEEFINGNTNKSITLLEHARKNFTSVNLYIYLGDNYQDLKMYDKAEDSYLKAMYMQPAKFLPKHKLLLFYLKRGMTKKADEIAKYTSIFPIKIQSRETSYYKQYAIDFIEERKINTNK